MKPAKLIAALLLAFGSLTLAAVPAYAGSDNSNSSSDNKSSDNKSSDNKSSDNKSSSSSSSAVSCSTQVSNTCGVPVVVSTCTGSGVQNVSDDHDESGESDDGHDSKDKDSHGKNDHDYAHRDPGHEHDDRSHDASGNKVSICHRMGGHENNLTVANDGWLHGHSKHDLDTIGRCEDFDARDTHHDNDDSEHWVESESSHSIKKSDGSSKVTPGVIACMKNPVSQGGLGCNSAGTSCVISSIGGNAPSRGGARSLR